MEVDTTNGYIVGYKLQTLVPIYIFYILMEQVHHWFQSISALHHLVGGLPLQSVIELDFSIHDHKLATTVLMAKLGKAWDAIKKAKKK